MKESLYITVRLITAFLQSIPFYLCRLFHIRQRKIVFTTIEGTTGFTCNPKYIALELMHRNEKLPENEKYELVWLVNDFSKQFPAGIKKIKNSLWNRAYQLTTAGIWIDNSRKQLEARKRKGQIYIQTWHAKLGFKPTCLDRGASFSRIAYLVSKHDSDMIDYWLSNSDWYDKTLKTGSLYEGKTLRTGSPRCDVLIKAADDKTCKNKIKEMIIDGSGMKIHKNSIDSIHFLMYAPTFRGGSQGIDRKLSDEEHMPDFEKVVHALEDRFGDQWYILLRLHPQLTARNISSSITGNLSSTVREKTADVSKVDDMYEILAGCDAFMTDYSSAAFDAAVMRIPVVLYCDDYVDYQGERGRLLWDLQKLPFPLAQNVTELETVIRSFDEDKYRSELELLFSDAGMIEDGHATERVANFIEEQLIEVS